MDSNLNIKLSESECPKCVLYVFLFIVAANSMFTAFLCMQLVLGAFLLPCSFSAAPLKILFFSVTVGDTPMNGTLNHQMYCNKHGYEYKNFYFTVDEFTKISGSPTKPAWATVMVVQDLFQTSDADYFVKLDLDCLFMRTDLRFESFIDPENKYSFYISETAPGGRFMSSHTWMIKNKSNFSTSFIEEWSSYRNAGHCGDIAAEQGSLNMLVTKKFADLVVHPLTNKTFTDLECHMRCHQQRSAWKIQSCVQGWFEENGMPDGGGTSVTGPAYHPHIKILPTPMTHNSPQDGWSFHQHPAATDILVDEKPLTYHPCKNMMYETPEYVRANWKQCKK